MNVILKGFVFEVLRVFVASLPPVLLAYVGFLPPEWVPVATVLIRALDRGIVSKQKASAVADDRTLSGYTGLTGF